ncbi:MAG: SET domain-containing protein-lysine N-methyltransferase [Proteobacteria bacterium]|nr:SET domain-containing protein-lysine N-methyltransferase [Pseudomonadota bacterium]
MQGLKVIRSKIHGYGVIALRPFREGETVAYGDGIVYTEDDDFDDTYSLILHYGEDESDPQLLLDLTDQTRWINHSCDPNTEVDTYWDAETRTATAWWLATRDIEPGDELTYDYAFAPELAEPCFCGSELCRGVIVDEDEIENVSDRLKHLVRNAALQRSA